MATLRAAAAAMTDWQMARPSPFAVVHGDYRLDNLLFDPAGADVVVVDWQTLSVGPPTRDLAYFLGTSLTVDDRRAAEREPRRRLPRGAVRAWGDRLRRRSVLRRLPRSAQLQGPMVTTIGCAYATGPRSADADEMFLAMARRSCAAIRDLDSLAAIGIDDGSAG